MNHPLLAVGLLALAASNAPPALMPHPSAFRMANEARAIVEGKLQADGSVAVTKLHFAADGVQVADSIRVKGLAGMPMVDDPFGASGAKAVPIEPDAVLLFLDARGGDGQWAALHHYGDAARGVLWLVGEQVFGYAQAMNPGPYVLGTWTGRIDGGACAELTPDEVRAEIVAGLAARVVWQKTMAIADPDLRAKALTVWFSPATSPDGRWSGERARDLHDACDALDGHMVAPLAGVVQNDPAPEAVAQAAYLLSHLGQPLAKAVPSLIARLRELRGAGPTPLLDALRAARDSRACDVLRDYVLHEDPFVAATAARALADSGDPGAAALLAARVPGMIFSASEVAGLGLLLDVLHDLDAAAAEELLRERFLEWEALTGRRDWTRRVRDEAAARGR